MVRITNSSTVLDYQAMWQRLRDEMLELQEKNVQLHAAIVLGYMDFLLQAEQLKDRQE